MSNMTAVIETTANGYGILQCHETLTDTMNDRTRYLYRHYNDMAIQVSWGGFRFTNH